MTWVEEVGVPAMARRSMRNHYAHMSDEFFSLKTIFSPAHCGGGKLFSRKTICLTRAANASTFDGHMTHRSIAARQAQTTIDAEGALRNDAPR
jgi:hypothetical protein